LSSAVPELFASPDAFVQEDRRGGELDGGVDRERVWMACDCRAGIAHPVEPPEQQRVPDSRMKL
jgi:hypothetical protein